MSSSGRALTRFSALALAASALVIWGCDAAPETGEPPAAADGAAEEVRTDRDASLPVDASLPPDDGGSLQGAAEPGVAGDPAQLAEARQRIVDYYAAIDASDYERAYAAWGDEGRASGQTYLQFVAGFAETARVSVEVGEPGRIEGAAGSRYVQIPVVVTARRKGGQRERFEGSYTLRRAVVEGASASQRRWHLHDASLEQVD